MSPAVMAMRNTDSAPAACGWSVTAPAAIRRTADVTVLCRSSMGTPLRAELRPKRGLGSAIDLARTVPSTDDRLEPPAAFLGMTLRNLAPACAVRVRFAASSADWRGERSLKPLAPYLLGLSRLDAIVTARCGSTRHGGSYSRSRSPSG